MEESEEGNEKGIVLRGEQGNGLGNQMEIRVNTGVCAPLEGGGGRIY